jgi:hypothetical protein
MPSRAGSTPTVAAPRNASPSGRPSPRAVAGSVTRTAAAPSASPQELPAVTVPPDANTGGKRASSPAVRVRRGPLSARTSPRGPDTGTSSAANLPVSVATSARWWLRRA